MAYNEQNLIPNSQRTPEELREMTRKGGIKSGEARRARKSLRERLIMFGELKVSGKNARQMEELGIPVDEQDRLTQIAISQYQKAMKGDTAAFNAIRDTIGEKPTNDININGELSNKITIEFVRTGIEPKEREDDISDK